MIHSRKLGIILISLFSVILLSGCMALVNKLEPDPYESVQKYNGQGYSLPNGTENDKIAEASREEIVSAMEEFFINKYKTKVKVRNIIGNRHGATVYVESVGEPHFHTSAMIPIDNHDEIRPEGIWTETNQVEAAIQSGIYALIFEDQLRTLDEYLNKITQEYNITGITEAALQKTASSGYETPYYYIIAYTDDFTPFLNQYLEKPKTTKQEWKSAAKNLKINPEELSIVINLYMKEKNKEPDKKAFKQIVSYIETMQNLPSANYTIQLHDNKISKKNGSGSKDNSLERGSPNEIIRN